MQCECACPIDAGSGSLPISRPQADAALHLPSQPSGSQHAAHPHGPPRGPPSHAPSNPGPSSEATQQPVQPSAAAPAASGVAPSAQQLLDDVLGHDDDDSIWMPPASLPESQGPSQQPEAKDLPALPASRAVQLPLMSVGPGAGQLGAAAPAKTVLPAVVPGLQPVAEQQQEQQQPKEGMSGADGSDGSETQDSDDEAKGKAAASRQGRLARGAAAAAIDKGMLTGAYAFPESSMEASQPAAATTGRQTVARGKRATACKAGTAGSGDLKSKAGTAGTGDPKSKAGTAGTSSKAGKAGTAGSGYPESKVGTRGKADKAGLASKAGHIDTAGDKDTGSANGSEVVAAGAKAGRAVPSSWKTKKAAAVPDDAAPAAGMLGSMLFNCCQ